MNLPPAAGQAISLPEEKKMTIIPLPAAARTAVEEEQRIKLVPQGPISEESVINAPGYCFTCGRTLDIDLFLILIKNVEQTKSLSKAIEEASKLRPDVKLPSISDREDEILSTDLDILKRIPKLRNLPPKTSFLEKLCQEENTMRQGVCRYMDRSKMCCMTRIQNPPITVMTRVHKGYTAEGIPMDALYKDFPTDKLILYLGKDHLIVKNRLAQEALERDAKKFDYDGDLAQYQLTQTLLTKLSASSENIYGKNNFFEIKKLFEKWIDSLVNEKKEEKWSVYRESKMTDQFNVELVDKLKPFVRDPTKAVTNMLEQISAFLKKEPPIIKEETKCTDYRIMIGSRYESMMTARLKQLIGIGGCNLTIAVSLRYDIMAPGGQQMSIPRGYYKFLYDKFGVRNEAFSSAINAQLLGLPDTRFCSLFPDIESKFGSIGNFWDVDMLKYPGAWMINCPFISSLAIRAVQKVESEMKRISDVGAAAKEEKRGEEKGSGDIGAAAKEEKRLTAFILLHDEASIKLMKESKFIVAEKILKSGEYGFDDPSGRFIVATFDTTFFLLSTSPVENASSALSTFKIGAF